MPVLSSGLLNEGKNLGLGAGEGVCHEAADTVTAYGIGSNARMSRSPFEIFFLKGLSRDDFEIVNQETSRGRTFASAKVGT